MARGGRREGAEGAWRRHGGDMGEGGGWGGAGGGGSGGGGGRRGGGGGREEGGEGEFGTGKRDGTGGGDAGAGVDGEEERATELTLTYRPENMKFLESPADSPLCFPKVNSKIQFSASG